MSESNQMVMNDRFGTVTYNKSVFSAIARNVIDDSDQVEVAESSKVFRADHITQIRNNELYITIPVRIAYSANVTDVCNALQKKIYESIEYMTDYKPESIQIQVVGFIF